MEVKFSIVFRERVNSKEEGCSTHRDLLLAGSPKRCYQVKWGDLSPEASAQPVSRIFLEALGLIVRKNSRSDQTQWMNGGSRKIY